MSARLLPRSLVLLLVLGLLTVAMPVTPVVAREVAPETVSEVLEGLKPVPEGADDPDDGDALTDGGAPQADGSETADLPEASATDATDVVESEIKQASIPFNNLGIKASGDQTVQFRTLSLDGDWQPWQTVEPLDEEDGPDDGSREAEVADSIVHRGWVSDAIWVGDSTHIQLRVEGGDLDDIEVHTIDSMGLSESLWQRVSRSVRGFTTPAPAEASSYPGLVTRRQWGADESMRRGSPSYATVRFAVLHHTAGTNNYSQAQAPGIVRGIYHWHTQGNGWADVGYNILVDRYGTVYEGRFGGVDRGVVGAHAANYNTGSFGVGVMGNFDIAAVPAAAFNATRNVMAWKYQIHGMNPNTSATTTANGRTIPTLVGHRDVGSTACPGRHFYSRMGELRTGIAGRVASAPIATSSTGPWPTNGSGAGAGWVPLTGDWNGDGRTTIGRYRNGQWRLWGTGSSGTGTASFSYGSRGDIAVVGDWNGNGRTGVGIVRDGRWHLRNSLSGGAAQIPVFTFGRVTQGDVPLVGDWNGNGRAGIGIIRNGRWHLRNSLSGGAAQIPVFTYGQVSKGDVPIVGDWNGNGRETIGIVRNGRWHLRNSHSGGSSHLSFTYGRVLDGDIPVIGDWNRNGRAGPGIDRAGTWHLRNSLSGGGADASFGWR